MLKEFTVNRVCEGLREIGLASYSRILGDIFYAGPTLTTLNIDLSTVDLVVPEVQVLPRLPNLKSSSVSIPSLEKAVFDQYCITMEGFWLPSRSLESLTIAASEESNADSFLEKTIYPGRVYHYPNLKSLIVTRAYLSREKICRILMKSRGLVPWTQTVENRDLKDNLSLRITTYRNGGFENLDIAWEDCLRLWDWARPGGDKGLRTKAEGRYRLGFEAVLDFWLTRLQPLPSLKEMTRIKVDSPEIASASLHVSIPRLFHLYALPFVPFYPLLAYAYYFRYDEWIKSEEWTFLACVIVFGGHALSFLVTRWSAGAKAWVTSRSAGQKGIESANCVRVIPAPHRGKGEIVPLEKSEDGQVRFSYNHATYILSPTASTTEEIVFQPLPYPSSSHPTLAQLSKSVAVSSAKAEQLTTLFGPNNFPIPIPTFLSLFGEHATAPFFVFQIFCVALWCLDEYWYYSIFTLFMLIMFECTVVWQRLRTLQEFRTMSIEPYDIYCFRDGKWKIISTEALVPGDMVSVKRVQGKSETTIPADLLLLEGSAILNEAMLSGESTPLLKESVALLPGETRLHADEDHKNFVLFGGTKLLQSSAPQEQEGVASKVKTPDGGCVAVVLRTGFGTAQGSLVRTMIFSTERVSANNASSFALLGFLLLFALAASYYVWTYGQLPFKDPPLPKKKLILDCILIVTSVVPPELPMELSMAVNASLVALGRFAVFCTEPFRIPDAGRVDVVCWDKTGTITGKDMSAEGVVGIAKYPDQLVQLGDLVFMHGTALSVAAAHALVKVTDDEGISTIVGDPMEKAALDALGWAIEDNGIVRALSQAEKDALAEKEKLKKEGILASIKAKQSTSSTNGSASSGGAKKSNTAPQTFHLKIERRFQFSSALKRMSTIAVIPQQPGSTRRTLISVKGAPETIRTMLKQGAVPSWYEDIYKDLMRKGGRVLALASREETWNKDHILKVSREEVECNLEFKGFLLFSCPLKPDAVETLKMIGDASHRCVMITGDNPLTAVHVARDVEIVDREVMVLDIKEGTDKLVWHTIDESRIITVNPSEQFDKSIFSSYDICVTGPALKLFDAPDRIKQLHDIITHTYVYARVSPSQKELILTVLKSLGFITLMAGDGTNDVGALKQAHVGVALLDGSPEDLLRIAEKARLERVKKVYESQLKISQRFNQPPPPVPPVLKEYYPELERAQTGAAEQRQKNPMEKFNLASITDKMSELESEDEPPKIKLGDASCAAPFTSKLSNVSAISTIIRQGRCTIVATIQMYKILALNCLITAYSLSVQYLEGIKFGDYQVTITGMTMSVCFYCISRAKPVEKLSRQRPLTNIFNLYILLSVLIQFGIHIVALVYITGLAYRYEERGPIDLDAPFNPNLLNSAIYLLGLSQQVSTFAINFQGRPFREGLTENSALYYGLLGAQAVALCGATDFMPELNRWLQITQMETPFMIRLTLSMILDFGGCFLTEITCKYLFADLEPKDFVTRGRERRELRRAAEELGLGEKKTQ